MASVNVHATVLQDAPPIYLAVIQGSWLLEHCTPSWRIRDPIKGFQRVVREERARAIATAVLDQQRSFPNAIVLATDLEQVEQRNGLVHLPGKARFLIVDGQHRLWAQQFSRFQAPYACVIHLGLSEVQMARLFLEINDNQKRVPSSLRWDLVRLVRPADDPYAISTAELIYQLATEQKSPLYQRVDLTGEQSEITLKQASLGPEIKMLVSSKASPIRPLDFESQYDLLIRYFSAIRSRDPDGWRTSDSPLYKARVLRILLRLLPEILREMRWSPSEVRPAQFLDLLSKLDLRTLSPARIRAAQGNAGLKEIYYVIRRQLFR